MIMRITPLPDSSQIPTRPPPPPPPSQAIYMALVALFVWVPTRLVGRLLPGVMPVRVRNPRHLRFSFYLRRPRREGGERGGEGGRGLGVGGNITFFFRIALRMCVHRPTYRAFELFY